MPFPRARWPIWSSPGMMAACLLRDIDGEQGTRTRDVGGSDQ
jgi:hypothetical protein